MATVYRGTVGNAGKKTALIAGGAGFLGSHLCDALIDRGYRVICLDSFLTGARPNLSQVQDHPRFQLVEHDICTPVEVDGRINEIYNLACAASPPRYQKDPVHTMMTSVAGTKHLLDLSMQHGARFVQASTSEVYGNPEIHPQPETYAGRVNCTGPRACYDEGKRAAEALCFDYLRMGRADVRVARIFNTYGPRMQADDGRVISTLLSQALAGEPLTVYGNGRQTRSFCYVSDMVDGLMALMAVQNNPGSPINLGNPSEFSINELAEIIRGRFPGATITSKPIPEDDPQMRKPDTSRAFALLGWRARVKLEDGLQRTLDWLAPNSARDGTRSRGMTRIEPSRRIAFL